MKKPLFYTILIIFTLALVWWGVRRVWRGNFGFSLEKEVNLENDVVKMRKEQENQFIKVEN